MPSQGPAGTRWPAWWLGFKPGVSLPGSLWCSGVRRCSTCRQVRSPRSSSPPLQARRRTLSWAVTLVWMWGTYGGAPGQWSSCHAGLNKEAKTGEEREAVAPGGGGVGGALFLFSTLRFVDNADPTLPPESPQLGRGQEEEEEEEEGSTGRTLVQSRAVRGNDPASFKAD